MHAKTGGKYLIPPELWKARKKPYLKTYLPGSQIQHFIAQPSKYAQRIKVILQPSDVFWRGVVGGAGQAMVEGVRGMSLKELRHTAFLRKNRRKVLDELAGLVADHIRLGVSHGDLMSQNIIVFPVGRGKQRFRSPLRLKAVDYELAVPLDEQVLSHDYTIAVGDIVPLLARDKEDEHKLKRYFERKFLERVMKL